MNLPETPAEILLRSQLLEIYADLGRDIAAAAPVCDLSGRCCRFQEYGHRLYLSRTEAELLLEAGLPANAVVDEAGCPFQQGTLCTARERRPMGCRVFFCDPRYKGRGEELSEQYIAQLKRRHEEAGLPWEYAALHEFLREWQGNRDFPAAVVKSDGLEVFSGLNEFAEVAGSAGSILDSEGLNLDVAEEPRSESSPAQS